MFGKPVEAIVRCAAERGCTKIVMGTKGRSLIADLVVRSVARRVVRLAHVPVTLIKESSCAAHSLNARPARPQNEMVQAGARSSGVSPHRDDDALRSPTSHTGRRRRWPESHPIADFLARTPNPRAETR
ncbi:MAG: universal stress protein [Gammaproteobacteria bacterium]